MIRAITVAREYGSGGSHIAAKVAQSLGWELVDRALILEISEKLHLPESEATRIQGHRSWWLERVARAVWLGTGGSTVDVVDAEAVHEFTEQAIREAYERGQCVIVGRGGQCVLRDLPDVLHVFVFAPLEFRMERLRHHYDSEEEIREAIGRIDEERAAYIREFHNTEWKDPSLYHLWINGGLGIAAGAELILKAMNLPKNG